jgi:hypothetical protein
MAGPRAWMPCAGRWSHPARLRWRASFRSLAGSLGATGGHRMQHIVDVPFHATDA